MPNPYLAPARRRYENLRAELGELQDRSKVGDRDLTEIELDTARRLGGEGEELLASITAMQEEEERSAAVNALAAEVFGDGAGRRQPDMPRLMPSPGQLAMVMRSLAGEDPHPVRFTTTDDEPSQVRAAVTLTGGAGRPSAAMSGVQLPDPRRIATAAVMPVERVAGAEGMTFPVFGAGTAGVTAEGVLKTEYSNIAPGTATPQTINAFTDFTRQLAMSHGTFEQRLRAKLATLIAAREDVLVQAKVAATTGIQTQAFAAGAQASQVLIGAAKVESAVGQPPDLLLCNPADIGLLFGAGLANTPPGELAELRLDLFGMKVYATTAQTQGFVLAGAWRAGARMVVGQPPTWFVDPYTGLKTNVITALLEESVDIAVDTPEAFISVDIVTP